MQFTSKQMKHLLGVTDNKFINYRSGKFLACTNQATGQGYQNKYTEEDAIRNLVFIELVHNKMHQEHASLIAKQISIGQGVLSTPLGGCVTLSVDIPQIKRKLREFKKAIK